ncbi:MAG: hypothetical protein ACLU6Z_03475 [Odoribacter splanchnicus]
MPEILPFKASVLISPDHGQQICRIAGKITQISGFFMQTRTLRKYNVSHSADVFGYIGEVSQTLVEQDSTYAPGDYRVNGLEKVMKIC